MKNYLLPVAIIAASLLAACGGDDDLLCPVPEARAAYPEVPYGLADGDVIDNLSFVNMDGSFTFQDIRADETTRLLLISTAAGWCATCIEEQPKLEELFQTYGEQGLTVLVSVFEDQNSTPATAEYAQSWTDSYELTFPVVADPDFVLADYYDTSMTPMNMIIDLNTMEIIFNREGFDRSAVEAVIERSIGGCE